MKKLATYLNLCTEVYELSKPVPPPDAYAFYRSYVAQAKGSILEPMCGTGRFLLPLLQEGFNVQGFDASNCMLEKLHAKALAKNLKPTVWQGFVEDLKSPEKYELIFIPSGSFGLIVDPVKIKTALKAFYDHLEDDGILLFEVETTAAIPALNVWNGSAWHTSDSQLIILSHFSTLDGNICSSIGKYELVRNNSIIHTEVEELKIRLYDSDELMTMLTKCGFKNVRTMKAFDRDAASLKNDAVIVFECNK